MAVVAPSQDAAGAAIDARIVVVQALVNANTNPAVLAANRQLLNQLQVEAVNHYMVTGWLNAATILATYTAPAWDAAGQTLATRVAFLQNLVNNPPAVPPSNPDGYGSNTWVTVAQNYAQALYAAQITLVQHIMDLPGGTSAATILAGLTGSQSFTFEYTFTGVGYTDQAVEGWA
jgi:hypothetical protein